MRRFVELFTFVPFTATSTPKFSNDGTVNGTRPPRRLGRVWLEANGAHEVASRLRSDGLSSSTKRFRNTNCRLLLCSASHVAMSFSKYGSRYFLFEFPLQNFNVFPPHIQNERHVLQVGCSIQYVWFEWSWIGAYLQGTWMGNRINNRGYFLLTFIKAALINANNWTVSCFHILIDID